MAGDYFEPKVPIMQNGDFYYPLTTAKQTILPDGRRLGGEDGLNLTANDVNALSIDITDAEAGTANLINADSLGGVAASEYLLKTETATDSNLLGGKAPIYYIQPRNLLDNSDFTNPVNQRGFVSGNTVTAWSYFIDRWIVSDNDASVSIDTNGLQPQIADNAYVSQRIEASKFHEGKTYTFAVGLSDGSVITASGIYHSDETDWTVIAISENENLMIRLAKTTNGIGFCQIMAKTNVTVKWAALYEGEYTADTLPPYVPKGYAQELAECMRYYMKLPYNYTFLYGNSGASDGSGMRLILPVPTKMRINPTVSSFALSFSLYSGTMSNVTYTPSTAMALSNCISFYGSTSSAISSSPTYINVLAQLRNTDLELIADL